MIVVVDDDAAMCQSLERLLRSHGLLSRAYTSATEFLGSGCLQQTDCLILDVQMPGQSGLDLQDRLRAEGRHIPILFITGYMHEELRERALKAGAIDMLEKPFDQELLMAKIRETLQNHSWFS